jgi:hypothetical protein
MSPTKNPAQLRHPPPAIRSLVMTNRATPMLFLVTAKPDGNLLSRLKRFLTLICIFLCSLFPQVTHAETWRIKLRARAKVLHIKFNASQAPTTTTIQRWKPTCAQHIP